MSGLTKGWRTSEFWFTALVVVGSAAGELAEVLPPGLGAKLAAASAWAYALARSIAKRQPAAPPVVLAPGERLAGEVRR